MLEAIALTKRYRKTAVLEDASSGALLLDGKVVTDNWHSYKSRLG